MTLRLRRRIPGARLAGVCALLLACTPSAPDFVGLPLETRLSFLNLSRTDYVVFGVREHRNAGTPAGFSYTPLLAPGATLRADFLDFIATRCPGALDLQVLVYRRSNSDVPIGLDQEEAVDPAPVAAGQVENIPACDVETLETYTIANWDTPAGTARVKVAQCSSIDQALQASNTFANAEGVWEVSGVDPALASIEPQPLLGGAPISGQVIGLDGRGVANIGVLVRSRYRVRLDCANPDRPEDAGYSDPIDFTVTDADGRFELPRPPGAYMVEVFADEFAFRPAMVEVETPQGQLTFIAEPL